MKNDNQFYYDEDKNIYIDRKKRKLSALLALLPMILSCILAFVIPVAFVKFLFVVSAIVFSCFSKRLLGFFDKKLNVIKNA